MLISAIRATIAKQIGSVTASMKAFIICVFLSGLCGRIRAATLLVVMAEALVPLALDIG